MKRRITYPLEKRLLPKYNIIEFTDVIQYDFLSS